MGSGVEQSLGRGKGGRSSPGSPVVMDKLGTLCAQASMDCRAEFSEDTECKTTEKRNPGTADQWERALFNNEMQKSSTNPVEEFLLVDDHLNQSGKTTSK